MNAFKKYLKNRAEIVLSVEQKAIIDLWFNSKDNNAVWSDNDFEVWVKWVKLFFPDPWNGTQHSAPNFIDASGEGEKNELYDKLYASFKAQKWSYRADIEKRKESERLDLEEKVRRQVFKDFERNKLKIYGIHTNIDFDIWWQEIVERVEFYWFS